MSRKMDSGWRCASNKVDREPTTSHLAGKYLTQQMRSAVRHHDLRTSQLILTSVHFLSEHLIQSGESGQNQR